MIHQEFLFLLKKPKLIARSNFNRDQMKHFLIVFLFCSSQIYFATAQKVNKVITEKNVSRILRTLSSDAMLGRPAIIPERIEPSIAFIEKEFKAIGLKPLPGLSGFRQQFDKEKVVTETVDITMDGVKVASENVVIISDKKEISLTNDLPSKKITLDTASSLNLRQQFLQALGGFLRDTTSGIVLVAPDFQEIFGQLKGRYNNRFATGKKFAKVFILGDVNASTYSIKINQRTEAIRMTNVAGMLKGKSRPDELVLFSAHYDHIGILTPVDGDSIANGADDDASGTTAVIELARYFKKAKSNDRTLIFVAFTAEETGGFFGSKYFSEQLNADKVIAMFNIEMIGKPSKWGVNAAFMSGYERSDFGVILNRNLEGTGYRIEPDPYPELNLFYRSDNETLARLGVPAHTISTDQIDKDKLYHTVNDEFETIDIKNTTATIRAIATSAKSIVEGKDTPTRIDKATVN